MDIDNFTESLNSGNPYTPPPMAPHQLLEREIVFDNKTGNLRQAGSLDLNGRFFKAIKARCERDLFFFGKFILGLDKMTSSLHRVICHRVQKTPPYRKLLLIPRDCFKTTIVSKALPIHKFIQPKENNCYWPGHDGLETKILLTCETSDRAKKHVQWVEVHFEKNKLLRSLWPHKIWESPKREARAWNSEQFYLPRDYRLEQSDPSMQGMGVGGAIAGAHPTDLINDDLVSLEAANSESVMTTAIEWQMVSRALMEDQMKSLEYTIGTRWAVNDLYGHMIDEDPTIDVYVRSLLENGESIFPEAFPTSYVNDVMKREYQHMFPLLYMNDPRDSSLVDFKEDLLRFYNINGDYIEYEEDDRDNQILELMCPAQKEEEPAIPFGTEMDSIGDVYDVLKGRADYLMTKSS